MNTFAFELEGFWALALLILFGYIFFYLPVKLVTTVVAYGRQKMRRQSMLRQKTIIAEYDPPAGLTPAEIGFLFDTKLNVDEIFATIITLQNQGLVTLNESQNKLTVSEVRIVPKANTEFEQYILGCLDSRRGKAITMDFLKRIRRHSDLIMKRELQEKGYLIPTIDQIKQSFFRLFFIMALLMILFPILAFRPTTLNEITPLVFLMVFFAPGYFIVSLFLYSTYQKIAGKPWLAAPKLKEIWSNIEGYRSFVELVELDNLQFETENSKEVAKNKVLPYAVALGFNTGWHKKI